jgi:hypothetical protein
MKAGNELDIAFIQSLLTGFVVMIFFLMGGAVSDKCSRFREINYAQIVRDETHWSRVGLFIIYVVCLGLSAWALKNINNYCGQDKKPCLLKEAFISH